MNAEQIEALLHSIIVTRAEMTKLSAAMARDGGKIFRRLPTPHQASWVWLGLPAPLLIEPVGAIRAAIMGANRKEAA